MSNDDYCDGCGYKMPLGDGGTRHIGIQAVNTPADFALCPLCFKNAMIWAAKQSRSGNLAFWPQQAKTHALKTQLPLEMPE